jgi:hypothetical protein
MNKTTRRWLMGIALTVGVATAATLSIAAVSVPSTKAEGTAKAASVTIVVTPSPAPKLEASPQCRADALNAYALQEGFKSGQYTVDDLNTSAPEVHTAGSRHDWLTVDSRGMLSELFTSRDPGAIAQQQQQVVNFPSADPSTLFNANNWGVIQSLVASDIGGNLGFSGGTTRLLGTRSSDGGDAVWLYVDPATCTVPFTAQAVAQIAVAKANGATIQLASLSVGLIRVACSNVGGFFAPKDWSLSPTKPVSVAPLSSGPLLPPDPAPAHLAPALPGNSTNNQNGQAPGAGSGSGASSGSPGTGTTSDGGAGNTDSASGGNDHITNPFTSSSP